MKRKNFPFFKRVGILIKRIITNPIIRKDLRGRMRGHRAYILLGFYLTLIGILVELIYILMWQNVSYAERDPRFRQDLGRTIFFVIVLIELLLASLIGPSLTSGSISLEREQQTLDLIRVSLLSTLDFAIGKLGSALGFSLLLILAAIPIESLAFFLGGVGIAELIISIIILLTTAAFFCALGLFFSVLTKSTIAATASSYVAILISTLLTVFIRYGFEYRNPFFNALYPIQSSIVHKTFLWFLACVNPFSASFTSANILVYEQNIWYTTRPLAYPYHLTSIYLPSPWIVYILIYSLLTWILIKLSIRFIDQARN